jgi:hypothetical protein
MNWVATITAGLIPTVLGFLWYNEFSFGKVWMKEARITKEDAQKGNMIKLVGLSLLFGIMVSMILNSCVIHQNSIPGLFFNKGVTTPQDQAFIDEFMSKYGGLHRTFTHGMVHGILYSIMFALPIIGMSAIYELKSWKYILIHFGYWLITLAMMGGLICAWV